VVENELTLHPTKTKVVQAEQDGFDFLGYHFRGRKHWVREKSVQKLRETLRPLTQRNNGQSLQYTIARVNQILRGWFAYFRHSRMTSFTRLDAWLRQRLRSMLRKRHQGRGRARGDDLKRWGISFFATQGLYSLVSAHVLACQSSQR
jgi:RNA-directed DNA polymerase